jgi:hypothetical protein
MLANIHSYKHTSTDIEKVEKHIENKTEINSILLHQNRY